MAHVEQSDYEPSAPDPGLQAVDDADEVAMMFRAITTERKKRHPNARALDQIALILRERTMGQATLAQIAEALGGISRERVRQIEAKAWRTLRHPDICPAWRREAMSSKPTSCAQWAY